MTMAGMTSRKKKINRTFFRRAHMRERRQVEILNASLFRRRDLNNQLAFLLIGFTSSVTIFSLWMVANQPVSRFLDSLWWLEPKNAILHNVISIITPHDRV